MTKRNSKTTTAPRTTRGEQVTGPEDRVTCRIRRMSTLEVKTIGRGYELCIESRPEFGGDEFRPFGLGDDEKDLRRRYCWATIAPGVAS